MTCFNGFVDLFIEKWLLIADTDPQGEVKWFRAEGQRESAAQAFRSEAQVAARLQEQLRQARWASFNQAERQFQLGEWQEGVALLARAIKFNPANQVAVERFYRRCK